MRKPVNSFPLTRAEVRDVERAKEAFGKALRDAGAGEVVPMLTFEFTKTMPVTERPAEFTLAITAEDKCLMLDSHDPAVKALQKIVQNAADLLPGLKVDSDDPVRLRYNFCGNIDLQAPRIAKALGRVNAPKP